MNCHTCNDWRNHYLEMRGQRDEALTWKDGDPRMYQEQCRVGDIAFQHLFSVSKGKPLPDWVKEGLPSLYRVLEENEKLRAENQKIRREMEIANAQWKQWRNGNHTIP